MEMKGQAIRFKKEKDSKSPTEEQPRTKSPNSMDDKQGDRTPKGKASSRFRNGSDSMMKRDVANENASQETCSMDDLARMSKSEITAMLEANIAQCEDIVQSLGEDDIKKMHDMSFSVKEEGLLIPSPRSTKRKAESMSEDVLGKKPKQTPQQEPDGEASPSIPRKGVVAKQEPAEARDSAVEPSLPLDATIEEGEEAQEQPTKDELETNHISFRLEDYPNAMLSHVFQYVSNENRKQLETDELKRMLQYPCRMPYPFTGEPWICRDPYMRHRFKVEQPDKNSELHKEVCNVIKDRLLAKEKRAILLHRKYMQLRKDFLVRNHTARRKQIEKDPRGYLQGRENDRYLLMATRNVNMVRSSVPLSTLSTSLPVYARPAAQKADSKSGSVTTFQPDIENPTYGAPQNVEETDIMLQEVKLVGGTCGGHERWLKTLATIKDQDIDYRFPDVGSTFLVDPLRDHYENRRRNPWTRTERLIFIHRFSMYPKNFETIQKGLPMKSVREVIAFYFENKLRLNLKALAKEMNPNLYDVTKYIPSGVGNNPALRVSFPLPSPLGSPSGVGTSTLEGNKDVTATATLIANAAIVGSVSVPNFAAGIPPKSTYSSSFMFYPLSGIPWDLVRRRLITDNFAPHKEGAEVEETNGKRRRGRAKEDRSDMVVENSMEAIVAKSKQCTLDVGVQQQGYIYSVPLGSEVFDDQLVLAPQLAVLEPAEFAYLQTRKDLVNSFVP